MHEVAALRTPLVVVPGPIPEAMVLARCLGEHRAADAFTLEGVSPDTFATAFRALLADGSLGAARTARAYELVTGHSVESPPVPVELAVKPPVETVALWSPRDGIVSPRSSCGQSGERDRAVALRCSHIGFASSDEAIAAVARELERG